MANSLAAVAAGVTQVQGCINGYGERAGQHRPRRPPSPTCSLKLNIRTIPDERLELLTPVAHHIAELVNLAPSPQQPYVGSSVFAHKAGLHASAIAKSKDLYEHIDPSLVGNGTRVVVSDKAGRSTLAMKAEELGIELDAAVLGRILDDLKRLEHEGYHFEVADGSLELLLRRATGLGAGLLRGRVLPGHHRPHRGRVRDRPRPRPRSRSTSARSASWPPPRATARSTPSTPRSASASRPDVPGPRPDPPHRLPGPRAQHGLGHRCGHPGPDRLDDGDRSWTTIGVSENIIEASWQALYDSIVYGLLHTSDGV